MAVSRTATQPWTESPPLPRKLQVEVTAACNLRCHMCLVRYRPPKNKITGSMSLETFKAIVDDLPDLEEVTLQGLGEPLLAPDLFEMISYAAERGIRMGFNTNGTFLTEENAERLVGAGLDWLHISVDGARADTYEAVRDGSNFDRVAHNTRGMVAAKRRLGAENPRLSLVFVAMRRNVGDLPDLVRLTAEWGVDALWVQNLSHGFDDTDPAGDYREIRDYVGREALWGSDEDVDGVATIFESARDIAAGLGVHLRLPRLAEPPSPRVPGEPGCDWPFTSAYVTHDGKAQPCCMVMGADRAVLGDVGADGFDAVWRNQAYRSFRSGLLREEPPEVCRGCSAYRHVF